MTISTQMTIWDAVDAVAAEESWWVEDGEEGYAIGTADENDRFLQALTQILAGPPEEATDEPATEGV